VRGAPGGAERARGGVRRARGGARRCVHASTRALGSAKRTASGHRRSPDRPRSRWAGCPCSRGWRRTRGGHWRTFRGAGGCGGRRVSASLAAACRDCCPLRRCQPAERLTPKPPPPGPTCSSSWCPRGSWACSRTRSRERPRWCRCRARDPGRGERVAEGQAVRRGDAVRACACCRGARSLQGRGAALQRLNPRDQRKWPVNRGAAPAEAHHLGVWRSSRTRREAAGGGGDERRARVSRPVRRRQGRHGLPNLSRPHACLPASPSECTAGRAGSPQPSPARPPTSCLITLAQYSLPLGVDTSMSAWSNTMMPEMGRLRDGRGGEGGCKPGGALSARRRRAWVAAQGALRRRYEAAARGAGRTPTWCRRRACTRGRRSPGSCGGRRSSRAGRAGRRQLARQPLASPPAAAPRPRQLGHPFSRPRPPPPAPPLPAPAPYSLPAPAPSLPAPPPTAPTRKKMMRSSTGPV
jgi:hypothetical protein